jgi:hypothetical protein
VNFANMLELNALAIAGWEAGRWLRRRVVAKRNPPIEWHCSRCPTWFKVTPGRASDRDTFQQTMDRVALAHLDGHSS